MSVAKFKVEAELGKPFNGAREATVEIDRERGLFRVRPYRRQDTYELPLWKVAELVIWWVIDETEASCDCGSGAAQKGALAALGRRVAI